MSASGSVRVGSQPAAHPISGERTPLARELSELLVEFSLALGHQSAYPAGHPMLVAAAERLTQALEDVLGRRHTLTLGIARRQFIIEGVATDPGSSLLANLAQRFHRHRVAALRLDHGVTQGEVGALLATLGVDPRRERGPIGLQPEDARRWVHAELYPAQYDRLELSDEPAADSDGEGDGAEIRLWMDLARVALPGGVETDLAGSAHPGALAAAINRGASQSGYDESVVNYLTRVAEEVAVGETSEQAWLRRRLSRLIASLAPGALERLLQVGVGEPDRRRFMLAASQTLAADAVLKVVEAAGESSKRSVSDSLMLLLGKLAQHAESESPTVATAADSALRENVGRLVSDWDLEDPNPEAYASALRHMVRNTRAQTIVSATAPDLELKQEDILRIGLEIGDSGPRVLLAVDRLVEEGRTGLLMELLELAAKAGATTDGVWSRMATSELLNRELGRQPPDFPVIEALVSRLNGEASFPLLDALAVAEDRSIRWSLLRILGEVGPAAAPAVAARLPDTPWFVQRNLLLLLGRLGPWPEGFTPMPYTTHQEPRVRREAFRLLLDAPHLRDAAIAQGIADPDAGVLTMVLTAAGTGCPREAVTAVYRIARDSASDTELRLLAVRALAGSADPERVVRLAGVAGHRRWWGGLRLAPKSPVMLAALKALAERYATHPHAARALEMAERHRDPEVRAAAYETRNR